MDRKSGGREERQLTTNALEIDWPWNWWLTIRLIDRFWLTTIIYIIKRN